MTLAALTMAVALALLFLGYESSRAASIALLAAKGTGLVRHCLCAGSPTGAFVLYFYTRSIKKNGPKRTLRVSNIACVIAIAAMLWLAESDTYPTIAVICFYVFREIYVSLLSTQH